ncbi:signal transduction histidine kinase/DNA-binding response OmpR family regulator [Parabacteroides sp. PF5-5]|uniref:ATP-binding response regulator n=1 Tax=unclassified Parabacteroides TaxID=2649774 RepID=UPI002474AE83|nr:MULTISPECIES: ATP-binding protein [unclassified Parabacteroides]MDH6305128.1 signal transduction histidine kinase/DNA-binding response OmpR family regulator [Parabacteroides sp. PH5-39]MDH6316478.1 signal transduction histidine kinase/DNA-binding response OmpR family regulator [Parabacteroides sp. PF5-13]MDH6319988.1 signal transduction histidine kinase/DNA-binding response OmpR family regulator [Parabacteroides sp. PH5-13]MDH6323779.1 signal transduction histidine kinase/DNA-binding respons
MTGKKEHLTRIVVLGYVSLIIIAACAVLYIFNLVSKIAGEKNLDNDAREKVYLIANVLSLLYEGETYTQFSANADEEYELFNATMDKVTRQMETLRISVDSTNWGKIDTIDILLGRKRENTRLMLTTMREMQGIYEKSIAKELSISRELKKQIEIQQREENKKDTVLVQREKKGFFKRLAEAFVPIKADTAIHVNTTNHVMIDSLAFDYDPSEEITTVLLRVQRDIALERANLTKLLTDRTNELRRDNSVIANEVNRVLVAIEEEEVLNSYAEEQTKQDMIHQASKHLAIIAVIAIFFILLFLFLTIRDISKSRYYRRQLEEANKYAQDLLVSRERMMLTITHDIRAPLSSIIGYIDLLKNKESKEGQKEYLDNMNVSASHILSLVNDLLDFHRLESGQMDIHPKPFHVPALFNEIYTGFKPLAQAKNLKFNMALEDKNDSQAYMGDTVRIRQVIGNLLSNAIKFTPKGNVLMSVSVIPDTPQQALLRVMVKDEGPGIAEAEQKKIFEEFTRLAGAEKAEGFGLGLSITGKLVSLMKGNLSLNSTLGKGSEFTVILPLPLSDEAVVSAKQAVEDVKLLSDRKINCLLVDDDTAQIKLTEELLKRNQVNVIAVTNPHMVLDLLATASFDIILTDIQMPGLDGYGLLEKIRNSALPGADTIPVVALSASVAETKEHYREVGFTGFLNKPFTANELIQLLNEILSVQLNPINISSLLSFAEEDKEASKDILKTFSEETKKNISLLEEALSKKDMVQAAKVAHKMIPLLKMMEVNTLVDKLKELEANRLPKKKWEQTIKSVIKESSDIAIQVENLIS